MPGSQLKRLKASLKQAGVIGQPQRSKKAKIRERQGRNGTTNSDSRVTKEAALQSIREEFNPFEIKTTKEKHAISGGRKIKGITGKPGLSKQVGEDLRRGTLLVEMKNKNKVGGIVDKRFGENDPTMAPEDKMLARFTREQQQRSRKSDIFNLEDDAVLTHYGQSLGGRDDFDDNISLGSDDEGGMGMLKSKKRPIALEDGGQLSDDEDPDQPPKKKSKAEVMKEVIAKSKFHKFERQQEKDKDEDLREELDAELGDIRALLAGIPASRSKSKPTEQVVGGNINPERLAHINATTNDDSIYDMAVREMTYDKRSKPSDRTKTAEELAEERAAKLEKLERSRQRRMRGEESEEDEDNGDQSADEDDEFGIGRGAKVRGDDADEDMVYKDSDEESDSENESDDDDDEGDDGAGSVTEEPDRYPANIEHVVQNLKSSKAKRKQLSDDEEYSDDYQSDAEAPSSEVEVDAEEEDDDILASVPDSTTEQEYKTNGVKDTSQGAQNSAATLAYTYPCPQSLQEFKMILKNVQTQDIPTVVKRIRVLHHASLHPENKAKLEVFSSVLLKYVLWLVDEVDPKSFHIVDILIRHVHSLSKVYPQSTAVTFKELLQDVHMRITSGQHMQKSDLILLTAISTIYPTSDHFHVIVTPAMLVMGKYLESFPPVNLDALCIGTYVTTLCAQYQTISKRVIPEAINFSNQCLFVMAPKMPEESIWPFPIEPLSSSSSELRLTTKDEPVESGKMHFKDIFSSSRTDSQIRTIIPTMVTTNIKLLTTFANQYAGKTAFIELFEPTTSLLNHYISLSKHIPTNIFTYITTTVLPELSTKLSHAQHIRRPLELHHHRPLPIPTNMPKFDESYSLDRHISSYDPDRERKELSKLKAEHKKERKGALKELRKDAAFIAREKLKERKVADKEYHEKLRRIEGMIQSEEGKEANAYERDKSRRKKK